MAKKKKRKFKTHGVLALSNDSGIEIMLDKFGEGLTARIIIGGQVREYHNSDIFFDDEGEAYFIIIGGEDEETGEVTKLTFYLSEFIKVK